MGKITIIWCHDACNIIAVLLYGKCILGSFRVNKNVVILGKSYVINVEVIRGILSISCVGNSKAANTYAFFYEV